MMMFTVALPLTKEKFPGSVSYESEVTTLTAGLEEGVIFQYLSTARICVTMEFPAIFGVGEPVRPFPVGLGLSPGFCVSPFGRTNKPTVEAGDTLMLVWRPAIEASTESVTRS